MDNHLSTHCVSLSLRFVIESSPTKFGFLACGVYPFHSLNFFKDYVTVALLKVSFICFHLEASPAVRCLCLNLWFRLAQSLPSSQMVRAWTFLYPKAAIVRMSDVVYFFSKSASSLARRLSTSLCGALSLSLRAANDVLASSSFV